MINDVSFITDAIKYDYTRDIISLVVGSIIGGMISWIISKIYYKRSLRNSFILNYMDIIDNEIPVIGKYDYIDLLAFKSREQYMFHQIKFIVNDEVIKYAIIFHEMIGKLIDIKKKIKETTNISESIPSFSTYADSTIQTINLIQSFIDHTGDFNDALLLTLETNPSMNAATLVTLNQMVQEYKEAFMKVVDSLTDYYDGVNHTCFLLEKAATGTEEMESSVRRLQILYIQQIELIIIVSKDYIKEIKLLL